MEVVAVLLLLLLLMPPLLDARTASSYDGRVAYRGTRSKSNKNKKKERKLNFQESTDKTIGQSQQQQQNKWALDSGAEWRHVQDGILLSCFVSFDFENGAGTRARGRHRDRDKKENWNAQLGGRQESQPITR